MDQTTILIGCILCLAVALIARWQEVIHNAARRNVKDEEREMLRRVMRDAERLVIALESANRPKLQALSVKQPRQTDRKPAKKAAREKR